MQQPVILALRVLVGKMMEVTFVNKGSFRKDLHTLSMIPTFGMTYMDARQHLDYVVIDKQIQIKW